MYKRQRQYRTPLEYGCQRTPTAQWTVTGAGAVILQRGGDGPCITHVTPGKIVDKGVTDTNNMGAAMAPAAYDTLCTHFQDTGRGPDFYDCIVTGDLGELGGICAKGLTLHRREGNPAPRIAETPMGILNSVGHQNPGVDAFIEEELPFLRQFDTKVIANISGNTPEEYGVMCEKLSGAGVDMIEVNISCPNVKAGGLAYGTRPELAAEVTKVAKAHAGKTPVMVKLSPNVTDVTEIAKAVADAGADALSLINTLRGMRIDVNTGRPILKMNTGGLSGPAVLPVAVRMVWEVSCALPGMPLSLIHI